MVLSDDVISRFDVSDQDCAIFYLHFELSFKGVVHIYRSSDISESLLSSKVCLKSDGNAGPSQGINLDEPL